MAVRNGAKKYFLRTPWTGFLCACGMRYCFTIPLLLLLACRQAPNRAMYSYTDSSGFALADTVRTAMNKDADRRQEMVAFAKTLIGTQYKFGCSAPDDGFDCSGFINYVFAHFGIAAPRSSVEFTNRCCDVGLEAAQPGDLILFTGTNSKVRTTGHIGMIVTNDTTGTTFIHASSGKEMQVMISTLNDSYKQRFIKVIRFVK